MELNQINEEVAKIMQQAKDSAAAKMAAAQIPAMPPTSQPVQVAGVKSFDATEISELSAIREAYEQITVALGQLEMQKREVNKNEKRVNERLAAVETQEKVFLDKIVAKYGEGTFDINTGMFTPKN